MNNERRNPIISSCLTSLENGNWPFDGLDDQMIIQLVHASPELQNALQKAIESDLSLLRKLPVEAAAILLQPQSQEDAEEPIEDHNHQFHLMNILKRIASALGILLSLPLFSFYPLGPISFAIGIIPLLSGVIGNMVWRNAFRPLKIVWILCSLILSTEFSPVYSIALLLVGLVVLLNDKVSINWRIPPKGEDAKIFSSNTLTVLGIPLPWRRVTIERKGGILRMTLVESFLGSDRSQAFLFLKDPEVRSSACEVLLGGYKSITLKGTSHDGERFEIRLPSNLVSAIAESGILSTLCELAKKPEETAVVTHSHT